MNPSLTDIIINLIMKAAPLAIISFIIGTIVIVITIAYIVRLWLVQTAIFQMRDDLTEIKTHLVNNTIRENSKVEDADIKNYVPEVKKTPYGVRVVSRLKSRPVFLWLTLSIPILLLILLVLINI